MKLTDLFLGELDCEAPLTRGALVRRLTTSASLEH